MCEHGESVKSEVCGEVVCGSCYGEELLAMPLPRYQPKPYVKEPKVVKGSSARSGKARGAERLVEMDKVIREMQSGEG